MSFARSGQSLILLLLVSCTGMGVSIGSPHHVIFSTSARTGIEMTTFDSGRQVVAVGVSRNEGVLMPGRDGSGRVRPEPYPVLAISRLDSEQLFSSTKTPLGVVRLRQVFATGQAAVMPGAESVVAKTFDSALVGRISSEEATRLGDELLTLLNDAPARARADLLAAIGDTFDTETPTGWEEARDLVLDAVNESRSDALAKALARAKDILEENR